jgi:hypothetical protein
MDFIPRANSIDVFVKRFRAAATDEAITDAVLTFTIYDSDGNVVSGASGVAMPHLGDGHYRGTAGSLSFTYGSDYKVVVTSSTHEVTWTKWYRATTRNFSM